jgi:hypothetical protein
MNTNFFDLKRRKRDILYELLTDNRKGIISSKELSSLTRLIGDTTRTKSEPSRKQTRKTDSKRNLQSKKLKNKKRKTTHYLAEDLYADLDKAQKQIRLLVPKDIRKKVTKTEIISRALALTLEEFADNGKKSKLVQHLVKK